MSAMTENGFTRYPDSILDLLILHDLPRRTRKVFDCIIRKTLGFSKDKDRIALSQFESATGITKPHVCNELQWLESHNLIFKQEGKINEYQINRDTNSWNWPEDKNVTSSGNVPPEVTLPPGVTTITSRGNDHYLQGERPLPPEGHTIDTNTIYNITREEREGNRPEAEGKKRIEVVLHEAEKEKPDSPASPSLLLKTEGNARIGLLPSAKEGSTERVPSAQEETVIGRTPKEPLTLPSLLSWFREHTAFKNINAVALKALRIDKRFTQKQLCEEALKASSKFNAKSKKPVDPAEWFVNAWMSRVDALPDYSLLYPKAVVPPKTSRKEDRKIA